MADYSMHEARSTRSSSRARDTADGGGSFSTQKQSFLFGERSIKGGNAASFSSNLGRMKSGDISRKASGLPAGGGSMRGGISGGLDAAQKGAERRQVSHSSFVAAVSPLMDLMHAHSKPHMRLSAWTG